MEERPILTNKTAEHFVRCSICHQEGHNRRTCPAKIKPSSTFEDKGRQIISVHLPPRVVRAIDQLVKDDWIVSRAEFIRNATLDRLASYGVYQESDEVEMWPEVKQEDPFLTEDGAD